MTGKETSEKTKNMITEVQKAIGDAVLKEAGFLRKGNTYNRKTEDGLTQVVDFRRYKKYQGEPTMLIVDLAIRVPEATRRNLDSSESGASFYKSHDCSEALRVVSETKELFGHDLMFCIDIGDASDQLYWFPHDKRYQKEKTAEEVIAEITSAFNNGAMKFFDDMKSREKVLENHHKYSKVMLHSGLWKLESSFIYGALGQMDKAKVTFNEYRKKAGKGHKGHNELLDGYVKECGF